MTSGSRRPPHVVVAGHICLDIIPALREMPDLRPGSLVETGPATLSPGGPVGNVGLALHRLGVPVRLMGKIGDDQFGGTLLDVLRALDVSLGDGMIVTAGETTSYSVVFNAPGVDRTFLHCPGANHTFGAGDIPLERLEPARLFHLGYPPLMHRLYCDGGAELHDLFAAVRRRGLVTSLDVCLPDPHGEAAGVDWGALLARALPAVDLFAPSFDELCFMLLRGGARPRLTLHQLRSLADLVLPLGPVLVAIKLGALGLYIRTRGAGDRLDRFCELLELPRGEWRSREVLAPCFQPTRVAGTTGSGDCTIAGLLAALLRREDPVAAATAASAVGACSVEAPDATGGILPWPHVAARLARGWRRMSSSPELTADGDWQRDGHGTLFDPVFQETR